MFMVANPRTALCCFLLTYGKDSAYQICIARINYIIGPVLDRCKCGVFLLDLLEQRIAPNWFVYNAVDGDIYLLDTLLLDS